MTILYQSVVGDAPMLWLAILVWICSAIDLILSIVCYVQNDHCASFCIVVLALFLIFAGFVFSSDKRYTEIKATVNDTVSWTEINAKYELLSQEGDLYTFKLKEDSSHE